MSLKTAAIGLGAMGRHHARHLATQDGSTLIACCDADVTGRSTVSLDNLVEFGLEVRGLDARPLG